ncbi:hypothetical protein AAGC94_03675 [Clostridium sporogenes]|jgi:hypothetical protein|uniref:Uncharacterized protein n=2 Tax=Clostridium TaxID=1485 RepID=A0A7X5P804_CLOSG|nr:MULTISPECIES: hypothetical protein [Clostridium]AJD29852.1 hypothetical protein T258_199 [Clostridium botulinum Prevot_594]AKC62147.1 hypothetical protein CLSPO_c14270 [Clostridium sporogenes]AKJ89431.1 hypothetical protein CLSPOx_07200 [Clostridium sporogenes]AVP59459.1 hypothetical protein C7M79_01545 [Clostridium botulinum]AVP63185.1 hypothetical protein C3B64_02510 [Clostridium botulinum]
MKKNYNMKKTIAMKGFIAEFGEIFSEKMKKRLLELEIRTVLTRKEHRNKLDIKHVEHTKYPCEDLDSKNLEKEYAYGQFVITDENLYFSNNCVENEKVMQSPIVNTIYNSLDDEDMLIDEDTTAKKIDDTNIDYVIDTLLTACPEVSQRYLKIVREMLSNEKR